MLQIRNSFIFIEQYQPDMNKLFFKETDRTPEVLLDPISGKLEITGISVPDNVSDFYDPIIEWISQYINNKGVYPVNFKFKFNYFNTSTLKALLIILNKLKNANEAKVLWYYHMEDEAMKEAGELVQELSDVPFEYIAYSD